MINKVVGDTVVFEAVLTDIDGTAVTDATCTLSVTDGYGSLVLSGASASHFATGTYRTTQSTAGWNFGPISELWRFTSAAGTYTQPIANRFRMQGTIPLVAYVSPSELINYYDNIEDYYDGLEEAKILDASAAVNSALEAMGHKLPLRTGTHGLYDQPIRDWAAYEAVYRIVSSRQGAFQRNLDEEPWFKEFQAQADRIHTKFKKKEYSLFRDSNPSDAGIGMATKVVGTSYIQMETNWKGYGSGFDGSDFERLWVVEAVGTGTYGRINEATFKWSMDGGLSFFGTDVTYGTSSYDWIPLSNGVQIRFHPGTYTGSAGLWNVGDKWQFTTTPRGQAVAGRKAARSY
jgi:hypothetical protein